MIRRLAQDARTASRVLLNGFRARQARNAAERLAATIPPPRPGSIRVGLYFADTRVNLYQVRQWYASLAGLAERQGVAIITRSPGAYLEISRETTIPVLYLRTISEIEEFLAEQDVAVMLYVNQNVKNFQMLRYGRVLHVFINHGESDKAYMTSNQFKAYDFAFVAGQAALDRLGRELWDYDVARRAIPIGRPQTDHLSAANMPIPRDDRTVVFYAPTWEGDRPTMAYGSLVSHGVDLARAVLASPAHRLVVRPHPRTGVNSPEHRAARDEIAALIASANAADPSAGHLFDEGADLGWQFIVADVQITDISAMVYDRLATGRPLVVTRPVSAEAEIDERGYLAAAEWLRAEDASRVLEIVERAMHDNASRATLAHWSQHHFGDTSPGASTARFQDAVDRLLALWADRTSAGRGDGPRLQPAYAPLEDDDDPHVPPRE
ncbi:MAG: CDP-glycerol glycerophosphotransferase family protein [Pseudolysinimonas sp.]|uniref:CDP-glycerol glycerophosphotransferase family protein n=1 Tax=Pseudolysinimonas sp. TaxID=2680009 RepID=UPI003C775E34